MVTPIIAFTAPVFTPRATFTPIESMAGCGTCVRVTGNCTRNPGDTEREESK